MRKIIFFSFLLITFKGYSTRYYFNSDQNPTHLHYGDDARTSIQSQDSTTPWATVTKINSFFSSLVAGDSILLRRGSSFYTTTGIIIRQSGTPANQIVIAAYGTGAQPIVTSLLPLTFFNQATNLWRSNETINMTYLDCVVAGGIIQQMGRWPKLDPNNTVNSGWNTVTFHNSTLITVADTGNQLVGIPLIYNGCQVVYRAAKYWTQRERISSYNTPNHQITYVLHVASNGNVDKEPATGYGYFIQNDSATLTTTGTGNLPSNYEWWFDSVHQKLKMFYNSGSAPTGVSAATADNLVTFFTLSTFSWVTFYNIDFEGSNSDCIDIAGGNNDNYIKFQNCTINNIGRNGGNIGSHYTYFTNNTITNCNSKGINLMTNSDHAFITNNYMRNFNQNIGMGTGAWQDGNSSHSGVGIYITGGARQVITGNTIINAGYTGIHFKTQDSAIVRNNYIDTFCNVMDDGGGIYTFSSTSTVVQSQRRKIVSNISLHGIGTPKGEPKSGNTAGEGVYGIYQDQNSSQIDVDSNTVAYCPKGIFQNYGSNNNNIRNNTVYGCNVAMQINTRLSDKTRSLVITNNVFLASSTTDTTMYAHSSDGDPLNLFGTIDNNFYARPQGDNLTMVYDGSGSGKVSLAGWQAHFPTYDVNSHETPVTYSSQSQFNNNVIFQFNKTAYPLSISFPYKKYNTIPGVTYLSSYTIPAYGSALLTFLSNLPYGGNIIRLRNMHLVPKNGAAP